MFLAYLIVSGGAVLQVITVAVLLEVVPFCRHLRRSDGMVVFRVQVVVVVLLVYALYIGQKVIERLDVALIREHRQPHFPQGVERLEARKDKGVVFESVAECFGIHSGSPLAMAVSSTRSVSIMRACACGSVRYETSNPPF